MSPLIAIAIKDLRLLFRDRPAYFFTFIFPVIFGTFFGIIFGGTGSDGPAGVPIVCVDEDNTDASREFIADLGKGKEFVASSLPTRDEALNQVRLGNKTAAVVLPKGFGDAAKQPFAGESMTIEVACDPSRSAEAGMIRGLITERAYQRFQRVFSDRKLARETAANARNQIAAMKLITPGRQSEMLNFYDKLDAMLAAMPAATVDPAADPSTIPSEPQSGTGWQPVSIKTLEIQRKRFGPANAFDVTFAQAILWGVVGCASGFAIGLIEERRGGTLLRLRMAPLGWSRLLLGKGLSCFIATLGVAAFMLTLSVLVFKVRPVSWPTVAAAVLCVAIGFTGIMMLLAVLGRRTGSGQIGWAIMLVMNLIGGGMVPLFVMPRWMQSLSSVSPVKWGILAVEGGIWRGFSPGEMLLPCAILLTVGVGGFAIGSKLFATEDGL